MKERLSTLGCTSMSESSLSSRASWRVSLGVQPGRKESRVKDVTHPLAVIYWHLGVALSGLLGLGRNCAVYSGDNEGQSILVVECSRSFNPTDPHSSQK
jgi:hypothetical protein